MFYFAIPRLFVRLGETSKSGSNLFNDYIVARWVLHPKAKANQLENNIAILFLERDVEFSGNNNINNIHIIDTHYFELTYVAFRSNSSGLFATNIINS